MNKILYTSYAFYTNEGKRAAIFYLEDNRIIQVFCSKKDQFSRKIAKGILLEILDENRNGRTYLQNSEIFNTQKEFIEWCEKNYYKKRIDSALFSGIVVGTCVKNTGGKFVNNRVDIISLYKNNRK